MGKRQKRKQAGMLSIIPTITKLKKKDLLIATIAFFIGMAIMYSYNLNWMRNVKSLTEKLISNFRDTYNIQRDLSLNYSNSYDLLVDCLFVDKEKCKVEETLKQFETISIEREQLRLELEQKNRETEAIMSKYP